jgi:hypothetical protein
MQMSSVQIKRLIHLQIVSILHYSTLFYIQPQGGVGNPCNAKKSVEVLHTLNDRRDLLNARKANHGLDKIIWIFTSLLLH